MKVTTDTHTHIHTTPRNNNTNTANAEILPRDSPGDPLARLQLLHPLAVATIYTIAVAMPILDVVACVCGWLDGCLFVSFCVCKF